jgi:zinc protease
MNNRTPFILLIACLIYLPLLAQADRSQIPASGEIQPLIVPKIQSFTASNGLPVFLIQRENLPIVQFSWIFYGGAVADPDDKSGLARLTADMLDEGAGGKSALALADEIAFLGISLQTSAGLELNRVNLFTSTRHLEKAMTLASNIITRPDFPQKELERLRKQYVAALLQRHDRGGDIARIALRQEVFGKGHPYGRGTGGNESSLKSISRNDLLQYHERFYRPENAFLAVAGDISVAQLQRLLADHFGDWQGGKRYSPDIRPPEQVPTNKLIVVHKPGAVQSNIEIGRLGTRRNDGDYYKLQVMNTILGGSFTSRLNQNIREEHGYSYGARSRFQLPQSDGLFYAYSAVETGVTAAALNEFFNEFAAIRDPVPEPELVRAKNYLALGYPASFAAVQQLVGKMVGQVFGELEDDFFNTYIPRIQAVTAAGVEQVAAKHIDPKAMIVVVVGDSTKIIDDLQELNIASPQVYEIEQVLGPKPEL